MPAQIADGFTVTSDAVYWDKPVKDGATQAVRLASRIEVAALTRSVESQSWGRLVRFFDPDGVSHDWCIPQSMFGADLGSIWSTLLSLGCDITAEPNLRIQLARYLAGCQPAVRGLSVKRPGWTGNAFVFPDGSSYGDDGQLISFETRDPINQAIFTASGDATSWNEHIGRLCVGNTRLALAVCIALSGPTLHLLGAESSGFHFRGRSSIGKTTILRVACSVWGSPEKVKRNWRATSNGLEVVAAQHNDLLLALDEFGEITPAEASAVTYMLGNGQGKTRATATGGARTVATWRLPYISTGEVGLADHLQGAGITVRAGQEARFVDIEAAPAGGHGLFDVLHEYPNGADLSRALTTSGEQYHGAIGRAFVAHLADPAHKPAAIEYLQTSIAEFVQQCVPVDADGQVTRVAHRFGLVAAAGELAVRIGLLTWPSGEATSAARSCLESWIERRGGTAEMEREQACDLVRRHLELFGERNFRWLRTAGLSTSDFEPSTEHHGWKRQNLDGRLQYLILPSAFKTVICRGMDSASIARHLLAAGMLFPDGQGKSQQSIRVKDEGNKRLYVINPDLLGEADQPEPPAPPVQRQPPGMKDYGFKF
jgi:putative DNA primase/helicase